MAGETIGIDVGGTKILAARVDAGGAIGATEHVVTDLTSAAGVLAQITALARALGAGPDTPVGVGVPGTVDQARGAVLHAVNTPFDDGPFRDHLAAALGARVEIDNDGNCAALAEHRHGAGRGADYVVMLTLGTGVGGGVIAAGQPYRGARGTGAELGHIVIEQDGRPCQGSCPGRGHLEAYASGHAAAALAGEAGIDGPDALLAAVAAGDEAARAVIGRIAAALGAGLVTLANAFGPEVIVIGGGFGIAAGRFLLDPATRILAAEALRPNGDVPVVPAVLGTSAGVIGAAELTR